MNNDRFEEVLSYQKDGPITYIMMHSFRIHYNHGLKKAYDLSKTTQKELNIVLYHYKENNPRNNHFFYEGTKEFSGLLSKFTNNIFFTEELDSTLQNIITKSSIIIKDKSYLKEHLEIEKQMIDEAKPAKTSFILVESNVMIPLRITSNKEEYSAKTIRPKIHKEIYNYNDFIDQPNPSFLFEQKARDILIQFIEQKLEKYHLRNDPANEYTSNLSSFLKYGFISPVEIFHRLEAISSPNKDSFIEELIVRRELSYNFVYYNKGYDNFHKMTYNWAYETMNNHRLDKKQYIYELSDYTKFNTHDPYFNAAMKEMVYLGRMHSYMRMYWCKKIIEWSKSFEEAYKIAIHLNNHYFLDGNTPNGYTGVAWCFGKHDRAWTEREIFGKIRYMNDKGLKRKFDIEKYVERVNRIVGG